MRVEQAFQQAPHSPGLPYEQDQALQSLLRRLLPEKIWGQVDKDLSQFSSLVAGYVREQALLADNSKPTLTQYDHNGQRIDKLATSEGWRSLKKVAAQEGLVSIFYERRFAQYSRIHGFAKSFLWAPDSRLVGCPLAMTDGAAKVLETTATADLREQWLPRLISRSPATAVTAGQFMTERAGGTDVSVTNTVAKPHPSNREPAKPGSAYLLDGFKWFSSASDGAIALALARTSTTAPLSQQLSLFLVPLSFENNVRLHRLKDKIGTWALPTAELELNGSTGYLIGQLGQGVKTIAPVLNITRTHSATHSVASLTRALQIARAFAQVRIVRDRPLIENELHLRWLSPLEVRRRACLHLLFNVAALLGKTENGVASEKESRLLRLLTPVTKYFTASIAVAGVTDCIEALGGQGYMEEEGLGRILRDAIVERTWEGTGAAIGLDVVRVLWAEQGKSLDEFVSWTNEHLHEDGLIQKSLALLPRLSPQLQPSMVRHVTDLVGYVASAVFLSQQADWSQNNLDTQICKRWLAEPSWRTCVLEVEDGLAGRHFVHVDRQLLAKL